MSRRNIHASLALLAAVFLMGCESKPPSAGLASFRLPDADLAAEVKFAELTASGFMEALHRAMKASPLLAEVAGGENPRDTVRRNFGIEPSEVETLSVSADMDTGKALVSLASRAPLDRHAVLTALSGALDDKVGKLGSHAGVNLYGVEGEEDVALAFVGTKLVVFGTVEELKRGLETYERSAHTAHPVKLDEVLRGAPAEATVAIALAESDRLKGVAMFGPPSEAEIEGLLVTASATAALDVALRVTVKTEDGAAKMLENVEERLEEARESLGKMQKELGPVMALSVRPLRKLVASVRTSVDGKTVKVTATVSPGVVSAASSLAAMMFATAGPQMTESRRSSNETAALASLRTYLAAQNMFHRMDSYGKGKLVYANPKDGTGFPDLYEIGGPGSGGKVLKLIDLAFARATSPGNPRAGYYFVDIAHDTEGRPFDYAIECGLCAVAAEYGRTGRLTYIIDVAGNVYFKDTGGEAVTRYPDVAEGWAPVRSESPTW